MTKAQDEAQRRVEHIRENIGFSDEQATWWATGFAKGAEWQKAQQLEGPAASTPDGIHVIAHHPGQATLFDINGRSFTVVVT